MTVRAIAGLVVLNVLLGVLGCALLCALRPGTTRRDLLRVAGVAYLDATAAETIHSFKARSGRQLAQRRAIARCRLVQIGCPQRS